MEDSFYYTMEDFDHVATFWFPLAVIVGIVKSVGFQWILVVSVSFKERCSVVFGGTFLIFSFFWVYGKLRFLQPFGLVVDDCKSALLFGVCPQLMFHLRLFDLVVRGGWLLGLQSLGWQGRMEVDQSFVTCSVYVSRSGNRRSMRGKRPPVWVSLYF